MSDKIDETNFLMYGGAEKVQAAYFCSECGNLYDITNEPPTVDAGDTSSITETMTESVSDSPSDLTDKKKKHDSGDKKNNSTKKIYFSCTTCGNTEVVKPRTLVLSKKSHDIAKEYYGNYLKPENIVNIATLPHTRDYICPNKSCKTHSQPETRDATMTRIGNSFKMLYICSICMTAWK